MYKSRLRCSSTISRSSATEQSNQINMKFIILVAVALVAVASALPVEEPEKTVKSNFDVNPDGEYNFGFETEKGINRQESGQLKTVVDAENKPQTVVVVRGSYSYTDNEGKVETINYEADEEGYRAQGASIPVAPVARR
ncbi:larval cuticle protein 1-like [Trichoplusia ni]|uniref:Larval cuticle protein 1-like n=1 Tax=Trichoplusia ni TaxID=7111 RepID=A0A7E5VLU5_TRINI|nr:larval cuticle protein 1-like [Trichoplusia ni]